jgi:hypothetical protein
MIVLGADTHKRSHTIAAVAAATGELLSEQTVAVGGKGFAALIVWARQLGSERVWALEDCRHVSSSFERFLIARGERVVRVTTKLMAGSRRQARARGKSDRIDVDRWRRPLRERRQARARRRRRPDPGQLWQDQPPPPRPRRQPPDQRDHPPHRRHPAALPRRDPGLHRPQTGRGQEHQGSHPLPQAPPRPPTDANPRRNDMATPASVDLGMARALDPAGGSAKAPARAR